MRVNDATLMQDLTTNSQGPAFSLAHLEGYSITFATGAGSTAAGTAKLQASNNALIDNPGISIVADPAAVWVDIPGTSNAIISGTNNVLWNTSDAYYKWVRVVYTATSGAGTALIVSHAKGAQS